MKEKMREKLLKIREEFLQLENYKDYDFFGLQVCLYQKKSKITIQLVPVAFKDIEEENVDEEIIKFFSKTETIGDLKKNKKEFEELVEFCFYKYHEQFSFLTSELIDAIYGEGMNVDKFLYIINDLIDNEYNHLFEGIGFIITETIF